MVSFIIIAYNAKDTIRNCIESLMGQAVDHEIIVVDNNSTDGTSDIVRGLSVQMKQELRLNRGIARNKGLAVARGEFIAFIDSDVELPKGWAEKALSILRDHPDVAGVGGPGRTPSNSWVAKSIDQLQFGYSQRKHEREVPSLATMDVMYRAEAIRGLEFRSLWAGEDPDFNFRIRDRGLTFLWSIELWVVHRHIETLGALARKAFIASCWYFPLYFRNPRYISVGILARLSYAPILLGLLAWTFFFHGPILPGVLLFVSPCVAYLTIGLMPGVLNEKSMLPAFVLTQSVKQYAQLIGIYFGWTMMKR